MGELRNESMEDELLEVVGQVRSHLELQRTLGVNAVEIGPVPDASPVARPAVQPLRPGAEVARAEPVRPAGTELPEGLASLSKDLEGCTRCKLSRDRRSVVFGEGRPDALLVFVGEGPGQEEDEQGSPFAGPAGQLLTDIIEKGMQLRRGDVYLCTIVKCRRPADRKPEPDEIAACKPVLDRQLAAIKPKIIVALGNVAAQALLGSSEGITKLRGTWQQHQGIRVMPTYHPAYLLRNPSAKKDVWADIQKVMAEVETIRKE